MAEWSDPRATQNQAGVTINGEAMGSVAVDQGLRSHMLTVYNYMASGVLLSGIVALLMDRSGLNAELFSSPLGWVIRLAPLAFILVMSFGMNRLSKTALQGLFFTFAAVMGASLSQWLLFLSDASIAQTFMVTSVSFLALSLWGYTTKKDLSGWGSFLIMGVVGLILASIINIFLGSGTMQLVISFLGVLIFAGLTAYDTQQIKSEYLQFAGHESIGKLAIMGALNLYLDFVNMFQFLLSFMGSRD
jgi:FtsH-binding integral membrane protein